MLYPLLQHQLPPLQPCQAHHGNVGASRILHEANCSRICDDLPSLLVYDTPNLVNCGLWATLNVGSIYYDDIKLYRHDNTTTLDPLAALGLDPSDGDLVSSIRLTLGSCFSDLYAQSRVGTYSGESNVLKACTPGGLFPGNNTQWQNSTVAQPLKECLQAMCANRTLGPDLGGIGVSGSSDALIVKWKLTNLFLRFILP